MSFHKKETEKIELVTRPGTSQEPSASKRHGRAWQGPSTDLTKGSIQSGSLVYQTLFFDAFSIPFRYMETYLSAYPGYYFTGDGARRDENGYWQITGRVDDVINITGHRLGTAEVV